MGHALSESPPIHSPECWWHQVIGRGGGGGGWQSVIMAGLWGSVLSSECRARLKWPLSHTDLCTLAGNEDHGTESQVVGVAPSLISHQEKAWAVSESHQLAQGLAETEEGNRDYWYY